MRLLLALISPLLMALLAVVNPSFILVCGLIGTLMGRVKINGEYLPYFEGLLVGPLLTLFLTVLTAFLSLIGIVVVPFVILTSNTPVKITVGSKVYYL